jgi:hypothetical protein
VSDQPADPRGRSRGLSALVRQNPEDLERVVKELMGQPRGGIPRGATLLERAVRAVESLPDDERGKSSTGPLQTCGWKGNSQRTRGKTT